MAFKAIKVQKRAGRWAKVRCITRPFLTIFAVGLLGFAGYWATFVAPHRMLQARKISLAPKDMLDAEAALRSSILQLLGGGVVLAGLYFTARGFGLSRQGHITDRYTKAVELIGNENTNVRIGGLYAMSRIANDFDSDRIMVFEVLTAFIRGRTRAGPAAPREEKIDADVQAALSILGKLPHPNRKKNPFDFYFCGLNAADFSDGDFRYAWFYYNRLDGASFAGARLDGAGLSFCKATAAAFTNCIARGANFVNAEYTKSWFLHADLTNCDFHACNLTESDFGRRYQEEGDPPFPPAVLTNANFSKAKLKGTILRGVDLSTVRGLTEQQVAEAIIDKNTVMPREWHKPTDEDEESRQRNVCSNFRPSQR